VTLDVDGSPRELAYAEVATALVQVEFNRRASTDSADDDGED